MTNQPQYPSDEPSSSATPVPQETDAPEETPQGQGYSAPQPAAPREAAAQPATPQEYAQPGSEQSGYEQPAAAQPAPEQPAYTAPAYEQQAYEQQAYEQQAYEQQAYEQQGYVQQPYGQPSGQQLSPSDEKTWAIAAHLSPFVASLIGLPFLGPLVIYLVFRDRGPFVRHHAAQALNFQIIVAIGLLISIPLMFVLVGFVTAAIIAIGAIVFQIVAAVEANNGKWYRYPLTPNWVK